MIRPPALSPGDVIGVFTPSVPAHVMYRERYQNGLRTLQSIGFAVKEGSLTARSISQGYRSGTPRERADELMALFRDPCVQAIVSTIGGANSSSLIPYLDFDEIRAHPKVFCGYSDVTSLHMALWTQAGLSTFYGPAVVPSFGEFPSGFPETIASFLDATMHHRQGVRHLEPPPRWSRQGPRFSGPDAQDPAARQWQDNAGWRALVSGSVTAPVICANLNTLVCLAGTCNFPDLEGHILAIEEMSAPFSRYERNLRQLKLMGVFDCIAGLVIGKPEAIDSEGAPFTAEELLREITGDVAYPVCCDVDFGHTHPMITLAQGTPLRLEAGPETTRLTVMAPMVR
jgi:muramoyltetrapeptide carboxypeptidase LdcA involved in peptidoglycan recycling